MPSHKYRTEVPNTVVRGHRSKGLTVHAKWLYVYLKCVAGDDGECWQGTKEIHNGSGLSVGKVSTGKQELKKAGLITIAPGEQHKGHADRIRIVGIWKENEAEWIAAYTGDEAPSLSEGVGDKSPFIDDGDYSPDELTPSPDELTPSPDELTPSPDELTPSPDEGPPSLSEYNKNPVNKNSNKEELREEERSARDADRLDDSEIDAKQPDAKQPDAKQPDAKQPDAKQPDAAQIFAEVFGRRPQMYDRDRMIRRVEDEAERVGWPEALRLWRTTLETWQHKRWSITNTSGMLDRYQTTCAYGGDPLHPDSDSQTHDQNTETLGRDSARTDRGNGSTNDHRTGSHGYVGDGYAGREPDLSKPDLSGYDERHRQYEGKFFDQP